MKTKVRDTSIDTYVDIQKVLPKKEQAVINAMRRINRPVCNAELAVILDWPINCVTPRVKSLRDKHRIVDAGKRPGPPAGRIVHYWRYWLLDSLF